MSNPYVYCKITCVARINDPSGNYKLIRPAEKVARTSYVHIYYRLLICCCTALKGLKHESEEMTATKEFIITLSSVYSAACAR